jgi:hypothetical protein
MFYQYQTGYAAKVGTGRHLAEKNSLGIFLAGVVVR